MFFLVVCKIWGNGIPGRPTAAAGAHPSAPKVVCGLTRSYGTGSLQNYSPLVDFTQFMAASICTHAYNRTAAESTNLPTPAPPRRGGRVDGSRGAPGMQNRTETGVFSYLYASAKSHLDFPHKRQPSRVAGRRPHRSLRAIDFGHSRGAVLASIFHFHTVPGARARLPSSLCRGGVPPDSRGRFSPPGPAIATSSCSAPSPTALSSVGAATTAPGLTSPAGARSSARLALPTHRLCLARWLLAAWC